MASLKAHRLVEGVETEVAVQLYADSILVLVTQLGKVGSLIQASIPTATRSDISTDKQIETAHGHFDLPVPPPSIELTRLLGSPPTEFEGTLQSLYVSQIATILWKHVEGNGTLHDLQPSRKVIVGLALKRNSHKDDERRAGGLTDFERSMFLEIMHMTLELLTQRKV